MYMLFLWIIVGDYSVVVGENCNLHVKGWGCQWGDSGATVARQQGDSGVTAGRQWGDIGATVARQWGDSGATVGRQ
jgi:hypothetical protein